MKSLVIFVVLLIISMPIGFAKEVSVPELFEVKEQATTDYPSQTKEIYFYVGNMLIGSQNNELNYHYQSRLNSDIYTKNLPFGEEISSENRFSFTGKENDGSRIR